MQTNQKQLNDLLKLQQKNQLSSDEQQNVSTYQPNISRTGFRKPIKNPFSDNSESQDSQQQKNGMKNISPFPPKQPKQKSAVQQAQQTMKWTNRQEQNEIQLLIKLQGQGMKDKKIRELASKYKSLNIQYQKQKTIRKSFQSQLNTHLKNLQQTRLTTQKQNTIRLDKSIISSTKCNIPSCIQNQKKVMQFRLLNQNLKTQLNKAHRILNRQIGQGFNIDQIGGEDSLWKGRQQKIQKLKIRVRQLEAKLGNNGIDVSHMSGFTQITSVTKINNNKDFSSTRTSTMAQNKRKQFDNLKVQVDALKSQNQLLQGKIKSLASRKNTLEGQIKQIKTQFEKKKLLLIEKSQNDDKFISLLKSQNQKLKKQQRVVTKVVYKDQRENDQVTNLKKQIERLKAQLLKNQKKSRQKVVQKQQKCLDRQQQVSQNDKIQIKFPPSQKRKSTLQRPTSTSITKKSQGLQKQQKVQREVSTQKIRAFQNQHIKSSKYVKKLSAQQQMAIYQNWKSGKKLQ